MKRYHKYWRIAKKLKKTQLQKNTNTFNDFSEEDLFTLNIGKRGNSFFLGYYSQSGIELALSKYGIYDMLIKKGFSEITTQIDTTDSYRHKLILYDGGIKRDRLVAEIELKKEFISIDLPFVAEQELKSIPALVINWLCLQNFKEQFTDARPQLPGQRFPGLGLAKHVIELLSIICWRLNIACITTIPEHYHNATIYSKIFSYLDPENQAQFEALSKCLGKYPLYQASWGVELGCVWDCVNERTFKWLSEKQIVPFEKRLLQIFHGKDYKTYVNEREKKYRFRFDENKFERTFKQLSPKEMEKYI
jgi:hypothetical protein